MTKAIKKSLVVLCMCLCAIAVFGFTTTFAKQAKAANEDKFVQAVEYLMDNTTGDYQADLADSVWANKLVNAYTWQSNPGFSWDLVDDDAKTNYNAIMAVDGNAITLYVKMSQYYNKVNKIEGQRIYGSDLGAINECIGIYEGLSEAEQSFVNRQPTKYYELMLDAQAQAEAILAKAADAVDAIDAIYRNEAGDIVLDSEETLSDAYDALYAIYDEDIANIVAEGEDVTAYVPNYEDYVQAVEDYEANYKLATDFVDAVNAILDQETEDVCYSLQGDVTAAFAQYEELPADEDNNLKGLDIVVDAKEALDELQGRINAVQELIDDYITSVEGIGEVKYNDETLNAIVLAENNYDNLPADVLEVEAVVAAHEIETNARTAYDTMQEEVDALILKAEGFPAAYEEGTIEDALLDFQDAYSAVTEEQQLVVAVTELSYGKTVSASVSYYTQKLYEAQAKAATVIAMIDALPEATATVDFAEALVAAEDAYDALEDEYKPYVTNYDRLVQLRADYDELMQVVADWIEKVGEIYYFETAADVTLVDMYFEQIAAAVAEYDNLAENVQEVLPVSYAEEYEAYTHALAVQADIEETIAALVEAIGEIPEEIPSVEDPDDLAAYVAAVETANDLYEAMSEPIKEYFEDTEEEAYEALLQGLERNVVISVENKIALIGDPDEVTIASEEAITDARDAYDAMTERQDEVENYQDLLDAEEKLAEIAQYLNDWKQAVVDLLNGAEVEDLWSVDLDAVAELEDEYEEFSEDEQAYSAVVEGRELLDAIEEKSAERIEDLVNRIDELPEVLSDEDLAEVEAIKIDYDKLHSTQKALVENYGDLEVAYNKLAFVNIFEQAVAEIKAEIEAGNYVFEDKIELYILKSVLNSASAELQELVSAQTKEDLRDAIAAYDEAEVVINVAEMKAALENSIELLDAAYKAADLELQGQIDALGEAIDALEEAIEGVAGDLEEAVENLENAINGVADDLDAAVENLNNAIDGVAEDLAEAVEDLEDAIDGVADDLDAAVENLQKAINDLTKAYKDADKALKDAYEAADKALKDELNGKINDEKEARENNEKATNDVIADLQSQVDSLKTKTTITIIVFAVVCAALCACVIVLFIKSKKA